MISVFCPKTLIFAPECWKCRGTDFKLFPEGHAARPPTPPKLVSFFHLCLTPKLLLPYLELIENPALCYRKESSRAVVKGWKQFYTITEIN